MIAFRGDITEQQAGVAVDQAQGDLVVTINGQALVRLAIPASAWAELARSAAIMARRRAG